MGSVDRLSALDASFLAVESRDTPMHVGWVAVLDPPEGQPRPGFEELAEHIAGRLGRAPRFRQRLASVPFAVHDPVWVDDPHFDARAHLVAADGANLSALVDAVLSSPLPRDRPLWEIWIADRLPDDRLAFVGKMHHCMVDGIAALQLGNALLDAGPDGWRAAPVMPEWSPAPVPSAGERLAQAAVARAGDGVALALAPVRIAGTPRRLFRLPNAVARGARTGAHTLLPPAPASPFNQPGGARRHHVRLTRSLDEIRAIRRRFEVSPNDVVLAACAGALRRFAQRRGEAPQTLKAMVPADVRSSGDAEGGNRVSFVFIGLPCEEDDPVERLSAVSRETAQRRRDGAAQALDVAFRGLARTPTPLLHAFAHAFAHPRLFNLTISSVPGPAVPRYLRGCRLREIHSAIPLAGRHALSIGLVTVARNACLAITADARTLPDADLLGADLDAALDELIAAG
jgi:diacylglycerol O-acyltransferase